MARAHPSPPRAARRRAGARSRRRWSWPRRCERSSAPDRAILVDCLTLWLTNLMLAQRDPAAAAEQLLAALAALPGPVVLVSNEVGLGVVPLGALSRDFVDHAGRLHQRLAAMADWVRLHGGGPAAGPQGAGRRMHLLSTLEAATADVLAAVDLGQTPGEIVILSAADSELACLAAAQARLPEDAPSLRLANLLQLGAPALGRPACRAGGGPGAAGRAAPAGRPRLLALRGRAGGGELPRARHRAGLPARRRPRRSRARRSSRPCRPTALDRLWRYLCHGGVDNAEQALRYAASLIGREMPCAEPRPLPRAGLYHPRPPRPDGAARRTGRPRGAGRVLPRPDPERRSGADRRAARTRSQAEGLAMLSASTSPA